MLDYTTDFEVVWNGGMANDPLGGASKGCLLAPREQTEDERLNAHSGATDIEMPMAELERAVHRMNATLKQPVDFGRVFGEGKNGTYRRAS